MGLFRKKEKEIDLFTEVLEKYDDETTLLSATETEENEYETTLLSEENYEEYEGETTLLAGENVEYEEEYEGQTSLLSEEYSPYLHPELHNASDRLSEYSSNTLDEFLPDDEEGGTTVLSSNDSVVQQGMHIPDNASKAYLIKIIQSEKIYIDKIKYVIGSSSDSDYVVNNASVSRKHAFVVYNNDKYFIVDNKSTNKTLLDGNVLEPLKPVELYHGALIQFADELFQFVYE